MTQACINISFAGTTEKEYLKYVIFIISNFLLLFMGVAWRRWLVRSVLGFIFLIAERVFSLCLNQPWSVGCNPVLEIGVWSSFEPKIKR